MRKRGIEKGKRGMEEGEREDVRREGRSERNEFSGKVERKIDKPPFCDVGLFPLDAMASYGPKPTINIGKYGKLLHQGVGGEGEGGGGGGESECNPLMRGWTSLRKLLKKRFAPEEVKLITIIMKMSTSSDLYFC